MSKPPTSKFSQSIDYMKDWWHHKFWDSDADPNLEEEEEIKDKIVIVTGSNAGIGKETALQLAKRNAKVIMACRDLQKAKVAFDYIKSKVPNAQIEIMKLELEEMKSIHSFVQEFTSKYDKLDILVNNAGYVSTNGILKKTKDGFEYHIGVNHLGPFLLTRLLLEYLKKAGESKIVCVSSTNLIRAALDLDDLMMEKGVKTGDGGFDPYNLSKLANALCMRRLVSILEPSANIRVYNLCPGFVKTEIFRNERGYMASLTKLGMSLIGLSPDNGCETVIFCATSKKIGKDSASGKGEIYRFTKLWEIGTSYLDAEDPQTIKLYGMSEKLVGLKSLE